MSKKANPTTIGLFILTGLTLAVIGLVLFGSSKLFTSTETYVLYFDASVKGLNAGAPVMFRGVPVGSVKEVRIRFRQEPSDLSMPVIIEINDSMLRKKSDKTIELGDESTLDRMIEQGLRARLQAQSFVTGLLYVDLEILPNAPPPRSHQVGDRYLEIPTMPSQINELLRNLAQIDVNKVFTKLSSILDKLDTSLSELQIAEISTGLTNLLSTIGAIATSADLTNSLAMLPVTLKEYHALAVTVREKIDPLAANADATLAEFQRSMVQLQEGIQDVRALIAPQSALPRELVKALEGLSEAALTINDLAAYLQRNPKALLSGRERPEPVK